MKLWIDGVRPTPEGYVHCVNVNQAILTIQTIEYFNRRYRQFTSKGIEEEHEIELIDIDHDDSDYIKLLDWLEETGRNYPIHIHSMNPVGVENMRRIIQRNEWRDL